MTYRKISQLCALISLMAATWVCHAEAYPYPGQTIQINTHFQSIMGNSTWLLILRDPESGRVLPYMFDFRETDNDHLWVAFSTARSYIVKESILEWGPYAFIDNFCNLKDGLITGQSMFITLTGTLSPDTNSFQCNVSKYNNVPFPFVPQAQEKGS